MNKCLPPELTIESVDDILYRIGLCFTSVRVRPKRKRIHNPLVVFTIVSFFLIERVITISLDESNDLLFKIFGDVGYFAGLRLPYNAYFSLSSTLPLV